MAGALTELVALSLAVSAAVSVVGGSDGLSFLGHRFSMALLLAASLVSALLTIVFHILNAWYNSLTVAQVARALRGQLYEAFTAAEWSLQARWQEGRLQDSLTAQTRFTSLLVRSLALLVAYSLTLVIFVVGALLVQPLATLVFLLIGVVTFLALRPLTNKAQIATADSTEAESRFAKVAGQVSSSALETKVFGVQRQVGRLLDAEANQVCQVSTISRWLVSANSYLYKDVAILFLVLVVGGLAFATTIDVPDVSVVIALLVRALSAAQQANGAYQAVVESYPNADLVSREIDRLSDGAESFGDQQSDGFSSIRVDHVSYQYEGVAENAVENVSLTVGRGEVVGLAGPSGSGKSTLAQLILRLRKPTEGCVLADGIDYLALNSEQWSQLTAFVPQEPTLFEGTIAENIRFFRDFGSDQVRAAATMACLDEMIERLPDGLETRLGPRGLGLSGGQKQRVAIARALIGRPRLLVLDEPTSALDPESEFAVADMISSLGSTCAVLVVTHRESTERVCDRVIRIENGRTMGET